jgi:hypothetical protein
MRPNRLQDLSQELSSPPRSSMNENPIPLLDHIRFLHESEDCDTADDGAAGDLGGDVIGDLDGVFRGAYSVLCVRLAQLADIMVRGMGTEPPM